MDWWCDLREKMPSWTWAIWSKSFCILWCDVWLRGPQSNCPFSTPVWLEVLRGKNNTHVKDYARPADCLLFGDYGVLLMQSYFFGGIFRPLNSHSLATPTNSFWNPITGINLEAKDIIRKHLKPITKISMPCCNCIPDISANVFEVSWFMSIFCHIVL